MRIAAPAQAFALSTGGTTGNLSMFSLPGRDASTSVGGDTQAVAALIPTPRFMAVRGIGAALQVELPKASTASIEFFAGHGARTYISMAALMGSSGARGGSGQDEDTTLLLAWE